MLYVSVQLADKWGNHRGVQIYIEQSTAWATAFRGMLRRFLARSNEPCADGVDSGLRKLACRKTLSTTDAYGECRDNEEMRSIFESVGMAELKLRPCAAFSSLLHGGVKS